MRNCLVLGSGRSGTSMVAGTLAKTGYFMGHRLIEPREANPKGFFEDWEINAINEALLAPVVPKRPVVLGKERCRYRPLEGQRWLAALPLHTHITCPVKIREAINAATSVAPYCFKDPRFCYTLPAWRPFLRDTAFVCIFRSPAVTAASILKECRDAAYLHNLDMTFYRAVDLWTQMYTHVLRVHRLEGEWLFLHYNQLLFGNGLDRLEEFLNAPVDRSFPEKTLSRSLSCSRVPRRTWQVYRQLCELAECDLSEDGSAFSNGSA